MLSDQAKDQPLNMFLSLLVCLSYTLIKVEMTKIFVSLKLITFPEAFRPQLMIPKIPRMQSSSTSKQLLTRGHILFGSLMVFLNNAEFSSE